MNDRLQATAQHEHLRQLRKRVRAIWLLMPLVLGGLLVWTPLHADGQVFGINPIANISVLVGTPISISISVTNTTGASSPLTWSLNSNPTTDASLAPLSTGPLGPTTFSWTPVQTNIVIFTVSATEFNTTNISAATFVVTVTNSTTAGTPPYLALPFSTTTNITLGTTLTFTAFATNTDGSANALTFGLDPVAAAAGATITTSNLTSGLFRWTPTVGGRYDNLQVIVTEAVTSLSATQAFSVNVLLTNNCAQLDQFLAAVQHGGYFSLSNCATIILTNTLTISNSVTLDAGTNNVTISGNNLVRLFTVLPGVTNFTLNGLTISGGQDPNGGGLYINQGATAVLTNCTFTGNRATGANGAAGAVGSSGGVVGGDGGNGIGGGSALGGAIYNLGSLTAVSCQFLTNSGAGGNGGTGGGGGNGSGTLSHGGNGGRGGAGALSDGGAIYSAGSLALSNCTFLGNSVAGGTGGTGGTNGTGRFAGSAGSGGAGGEGSGAAVYSANYAVILGCTFSGNVGLGGDSAPGGTDSSGYGVSGAAGASSLGGGLYSVNTVFLTNCTFWNNWVSGGNGGGGGSGTSTLASGGNGGNGGDGQGGGLYNAGSLAVVNCTFSGCGGLGGTNGLGGSGRFAGTDGSMGLGAGGDIAQGSGSLVLANSILSTNAAGGNAYDSIAGGIIDGGYNISSDGTPSMSGTSLNNTDPQLSAALANNGGPTLTLAFLANTSPAIDKIPPSAGPATDQRGIPRPQPQGGLSDIGAYELVGLPGILTQPQSQTIAQGSNATFTVGALGASLTYQWRFNGTNLSGATLSAYTVSSGQATNTGNYDVVLANNYGSVTSLTALLVVYPFTISGQVLDVGGTNGLSGVTVSAGTNSVLTDANGNFILSGFSTNAYTVTPRLACYQFNPSSIMAGVGPTNASGLKFFATNDYHSVSGAIANGPASVTVTVTGTNGTSTVTSSAGVYGVSNLCAGFYFVVPSQPGFQFQPPTNSILVPPDAASVNFTAVQIFGISGTVRQGTNGPGLVAISVAISGPNATNVTTGANGVFLVGGLPPGTYVVKPAAPACSHFNLPTRTVTLGPTNADGTDFVVLKDAYTISGHLTNGAGGVSGITVSAGGTNSTMTDGTGLYLFSNLCAGSYTVTPSASCYQFSPASLLATVGPTNATGQDFFASPDVHTISGRVTDGGNGVDGVTMQAGNQTTNTDSGGYYVFSGLCSGSYTVKPSQSCRLFNPPSISVTLGTNAIGVNFTTYSNDLSRIRGQVTDGVHGLSNVQVNATGGRTSVTDSNGNYVLSSLCPGTYIITPLFSNFCFNSQSVTIGSAQTTNGVDFVAIPGAYRVSGTLRNMPLGPTVSVSIMGANTTNVVTTTNGVYAFPNVCPGAYVVTPSNACYQFYPPSLGTSVGPDDDGLDFNLAGGSAFSIRGQVTLGGVGLSNVTVSAAGQTQVTGADGRYVFSYVCAGVYPVTASSPNFQFEPATNTVTLTAADANGVNFAALAVFSLSGQVLQGTNGLPGVKVAVGTNATFTDASGYYTNSNLLEGTTVTVIPSLGGYAFAPAAQSLTLTSNSSGLNFQAFPSLAITFATNGSARLAYAAAFTCGVQASTNLIDWKTVFATNSISTSTLILQLTDTNAGASSMRFYRLGATFGGPPVLTDWIAANHVVTLDGVAGPILDCQIEVSTDLKNWTPVSTTSLPANSVPLQFRYGETNNSPVRFYRLFQTPGF